MAPASSPHRATRIATGVLLLTFAAMFVVAVERTLRLDARLAADDRLRSHEELSRALHLWEELQLGRIRDTFEGLRADPLGHARRAASWSDATYLWTYGEDGAPVLLVPEAPLREDRAALMADPCLQAAAAGTGPGQGRAEAAAAWLACLDRPPPVALLGASRAADQLLAEGDAAGALRALEAVDLPLQPDGEALLARGLPESRVLVRQLQAALAWQALGEADRARAGFAEVGARLAGAPGPLLDEVLPLLSRPVASSLRALGDPARARALERQVPALTRRRDGYRALRDWLQEPPAAGPVPVLVLPGAVDAPGSSLEIRALVDPARPLAYLLLVAVVPDGRLAAVQLSPVQVLGELLDTLPDAGLRVLDADGRVLLPEAAPAAEVLVQAPFGRLFPTLRLGSTHLSTRDADRRDWRRSQLLPISLGFAVAVGAFATWLAAGRQQRELWDRQQAFVGRVSHELKTPLAGIKAMAELMEKGIFSKPEHVREGSQRIITEVRRMEDRVNEILRLARRPEVKSREPLDLQAMAADLHEIWSPRFEQRGARLDAELEPTAPVQGDRELLRDAMNNLLDNALKYLREDQGGLVRMRTTTSGRWIVFEVVDNGLGVPEDMRTAIFERFTRIEGEGRGKAGGHGLGLAFVAEAVAGHGGKVECREGIAGGARFIIRLRRS